MPSPDPPEQAGACLRLRSLRRYVGARSLRRRRAGARPIDAARRRGPGDRNPTPSLRLSALAGTRRNMPGWQMMLTSRMRISTFALAAFVSSAAFAAPDEGDIALTCGMSDGTTVYFVRHYKVPGVIADNFEFYDSKGRINDRFYGRETDDKYRYLWGMLTSFQNRKTEYVYEIDRFTLEIEASFQTALDDSVKRLTGKCSPADFKQTVATIEKMKAQHQKEREEREEAFKRKQELEQQQRLSRRKL